MFKPHTRVAAVEESSVDEFAVDYSKPTLMCKVEPEESFSHQVHGNPRTSSQDLTVERIEQSIIGETINTPGGERAIVCDSVVCDSDYEQQRRFIESTIVVPSEFVD